MKSDHVINSNKSIYTRMLYLLALYYRDSSSDNIYANELNNNTPLNLPIFNYEKYKYPTDFSPGSLPVSKALSYD